MRKVDREINVSQMLVDHQERILSCCTVKIAFYKTHKVLGT